MNTERKNTLKNLYPYIVIALIFVGVMYFLNFGNKEFNKWTTYIRG